MVDEMMAAAKRIVIDRSIEAVAALLPDAALTRLIAEATEGVEVAFCFHRVLPADLAHVTIPGLVNTEEEIDLLLKCFERNPEPITMTFDDGYDDARAFIEDRAPAHPNIQWIFMICPEKTLERRSFPWDDWTVDGLDETDADFLSSWEARTRQKSSRAQGVARRADLEPYRLATAEQCRALAELSNVELGNHTNHHYAMAWLTETEVDREILDSDATFTEEFGSCDHFAFPFGAAPRVHEEHVERATELITSTIWTIENQPVPADRSESLRVRPRFAWDSARLSPRAMALFVALKCAVARLKWSLADLRSVSVLCSCSTGRIVRRVDPLNRERGLGRRTAS